MKTKILIVLLLFPLFAFTCEDKVEGGHKYISFVNNLDTVVYVAERWQMIIDITDTIFACRDGITAIEKGETMPFEPLNSYWETDFNVLPFIQFFVLSKKFPRDGECSEGKIKEFSDKYLLKRYQLTKEDLEKMGWVITYP